MFALTSLETSPRHNFFEEIHNNITPFNRLIFPAGLTISPILLGEPL